MLIISPYFDVDEKTTKHNAAILAVEMLSLADAELADRLACYKSNLCKKIEKANEELKELKYEYKTN